MFIPRHIACERNAPYASGAMSGLIGTQPSGALETHHANAPTGNPSSFFAVLLEIARAEFRDLMPRLNGDLLDFAMDAIRRKMRSGNGDYENVDLYALIDITDGFAKTSKGASLSFPLERKRQFALIFLSCLERAVALFAGSRDHLSAPRSKPYDTWGTIMSPAR